MLVSARISEQEYTHVPLFSYLLLILPIWFPLTWSPPLDDTQFMKLHIMQFCLTYLPFHFWSPNVHLSHLFSNPCRLCSYINITEQETLRYKPEGRGFYPRWWHNPSDRSMALGLTRNLTDISTRSICLGYSWQSYYIHVPTLSKFW